MYGRGVTSFWSTPEGLYESWRPQGRYERRERRQCVTSCSVSFPLPFQVGSGPASGPQGFCPVGSERAGKTVCVRLP